MKVLLANTYHYLRGGDCAYTFALAELLRSRGHEVYFFAMRHPKNVRCDQEDYFVDHIDYVELNKDKNLKNGLRVLARSIYSKQARERIAKLLDHVRPDIAHLQNIHAHLTPSIIYEFETRDTPIVWTLHDYKLICPNSHLLSNGQICESCKGGRFYMCTLKKCKKGSYRASLVASLEAYVHRYQRVTDKVSRFISPSRFLRDKFVEFGWDPNRLTFIRNFLPPQILSTDASQVTDGQYILYAGQLETWKGVHTLIRAAKELPHVRIKIAGDGSLRSTLQEYATRHAIANVEFLGHLRQEELAAVMRSCSFVVVPSEWYENCPYSVMEAMTFGKPVVASRIGGLPELVEDGHTGILVSPGDVESLAPAIDRLWSDTGIRLQMGALAKQRAIVDFDAECHYERIMAMYGAL
jgi:glycosyltransferase involved in cell wall biosynthesis